MNPSVAVSALFQAWLLVSPLVIAASSEDTQLQRIKKFDGLFRTTWSVDIAPDGKTVLLPYRTDSSVKLVNVESGEAVYSKMDLRLKSMAISPATPSMILIVNSNHGALWDTKTGERLQTFTGHVTKRGDEQHIYSGGFSPDGAKVFTRSASILELWDAETGEEPRRIHDRRGRIRSFVFPETTPTPMIVGAQLHTAMLFDGKSGKRRRKFRGGDADVYSVNLSPDGRRLVSGDAEGAVRVWDAETGKLLHERFDHTKGVRPLVFSKDGEWLLSGSYDKSVIIWDSEEWEPIHRIPTERVVYSIALTPDKRRLLIGVYEGAELWEITDPESGTAE